MISKFFKRHSSTLIRNEGATMPVLRYRSSPAAIFWRVVAIAINSIKRHSGRPIFHVRIKTAKRIPSIAHANPPATVSCITRVIGVIASLSSRVPTFIGCCLMHPVDSGRFASIFSSNFSMKQPLAPPTAKDSWLFRLIWLRNYGCATIGA